MENKQYFRGPFGRPLYLINSLCREFDGRRITKIVNAYQGDVTINRY
jgi:hypothetical protein